MRQSDLAILASGGISHTSDARITATADETLTDWELAISEVQSKDAVSIDFILFNVIYNSDALINTRSKIGIIYLLSSLGCWVVHYRRVSSSQDQFSI